MFLWARPPRAFLAWIKGVSTELLGGEECLGLAEDLSGHYSRDWSEYVNVIGVISEPFAVDGDSEEWT